MKRHLLTLAAIAAFAALVAVIVLVAVSSASGTPGGSILGAPAHRSGSGVRSLTRPACAFRSADGPSAIRLRGACIGTLTGEFRCRREREFLALSIRRPLGRGNVLYLTVFIPDYAGPGGYPESEAFVQVIGPAQPLRWTTRDAITRVGSDGSVELGKFRSAPEPGTPATGKISLTGHAVCAAPDRARVAAVRI